MDDGSPSARSRPEAAPSRPRLASLVEPQQHRRPIVVVLGMHRSGTSLCSNVLSVLGVDMADDVGAGTGNDRGHWERWEIVGFHDRILDHFNRRYAGPFHDFPLPPGWWAEPQIVAIRREITAFLKDRVGDGLFGFKDPRTVRLLPLWRRVFADLRLSPRIVLCLRKPAEVAHSLHARDGLDPATGEYRWLVHLSDFFRHIGRTEYCVVEYDSWFDDLDTNVGKLQNFLDIDEEQAGTAPVQALREIVDRTLRHNVAAGPAANEPAVRQFYELVSAAGHDGPARREIHRFIAQFDGWERLQRGFYRAYEAVSTAAERIPQLEAAAQDEMAAHQARLAEIEAERAEAEAERTAIEARAMAAEAELAQAQDELAAQQARTAEAEAELAGLRAALERQESDHALARAAETALRSDVAMLGGQLAEARDRAARAEAAGAEARHALTGASDEAAALREQLAAARTVGARLVAAFRADLAPAPLPLVLRPSRWQALLALLGLRRAGLGGA